MYDLLGKWQIIWGRNPWHHPCLDVVAAERLLGRREVVCGPSLYIDQSSEVGYLWVDKSSVKEEFVVRSCAVPSVVVFALGSC